ncbi:MAG: patatin-like phospholipase family protein [Solirubrobacteraceae bacterium]
MTERSPLNDIVAAVRAVPLFAAAPELVDRVIEIARAIRVEAGSLLFRRDDHGDALFVVVSGMLEVLDDDGGARYLLGRGEVIGELALLTGESRSASVRARRDSELIAVSAEDFERLLASDPSLWRSLAGVLAERLRSTAIAPQHAPSPPSTIALVPLHEGVSLDAIVGGLSAQLGAAVVEASDAPASQGQGGMLDELERRHDHVLLVARSPHADNAWTAFCLRQADRVVGVAAAGTHPGRSTASLAGCDLAFVARETATSGCDTWTRALAPPRRYRLGAGGARAAGVERMARRLAGRSVGVVLSGGGARGLAHLGVLAELEAAGIAVDRVGGTSMGALLGGLFACGQSIDEITARVRTEFVQRNPLDDYTLPLVAVTRGRKGEAMLVRLFGERRIEDLDRDYFCVSSDLMRSEAVVHRSGPLVEAVGASVALPGYVPPVLSGGRLLIDGGGDRQPADAIHGAPRRPGHRCQRPRWT